MCLCRLKYIMLLNYQLFFPEILFILTYYSQNHSQYKASYIATKLSLIYKALLKITIYPTYKRNPYKICGSLN